jgi:hypothetical protein
MPELPDITSSPLADAMAVWFPVSRESRDGKRSPPGNARAGGRALTLWLRLAGTRVWLSGESVSWPGNRPAVRIFRAQLAGRDMLVATLATDARDTPLQLAVPIAALAATSSHDLVLRYAGHRVELLVDGVVVDEEWPLGSLRTAEGALQAGSVDLAAVWDRALTDDELQRLSGGHEGRADRERRILGPQMSLGQFWSPRGFNTHVGDCMPFFHAGRFHLFYLFDRNHGLSKWGLGAHQWAHASTTDLVHWEHHPLAIAITQESEGSICTGSVFFHAGIYHAYYSVRMADLSASPLCVATSEDGIHFTKLPPFAYLTSPYKPEPARDPVVFHEEATGRFHLLATTSLADGRGCLAHLVSPDLQHWEQREPFLIPGLSGEPECPDTFAWRGWHYLIFSHQGIAHYRMARSPLGPWQAPAVDTFDGPEAMVMKTAAFTGDRRIGAAVVPPARNIYAGRVIFREIIQRADGTLGTKWPPELMPAQLDGVSP